MHAIAVTIFRDGELYDKFQVRAAEWSSRQLLNSIEQLFTSPGWLPLYELDADDDDYIAADQYLMEY